jgi:hypothetical protein
MQISVHQGVKVIEGNNKLRKVSFRLLQFNLYQDDFYRNVIEVFDGKDVSTNTLITELTSNTTSSYIANIKLNTSPGIFSMSSQQKLVSVQKEIVTSPLSYSNYPGNFICNLWRFFGIIDKSFLRISVIHVLI